MAAGCDQAQSSTGGLRRSASPRRSGRLVLAAVVVVPWPAPAADAPAPIAVTAIVPAGLAAGTTTTVALEGNLPRWPLAVWGDRPGLLWKPLEKKGGFEVTAAADALGVYRVRFHDGQGATAVRRFVVGRDREVAEAEPDDLPRQAVAVETMPVTVNGVLSKSGDADCFRVHLEAGQTLVASIDAHRGPGSPVDAVLDLVDERGGYLARRLDTRGLDPRIVFTAAAGGPVVVRVWGFPAEPNSTIGLAGGPDHVYRLTLTTGPCLAGVRPMALARNTPTALVASGWNLPDGLAALEVPAADPQATGDAVAGPTGSSGRGAAATRWIAFPGVGGAVEVPIVEWPVLGDPDSSATADAVGAIQPPFVATGLFDEAGKECVWTIQARADTSLSITVVGHAEGYEADTLVEIRDEAGRLVLARTERDAAFVWKPPADGRFVIALRERRGQAGPAHLVRLSVGPESPALALSTSGDAVSLVVGGKAEVPITVGRLGGAKDPVEVRLVDPPEAITAATVTSSGEGDSSKKVTLVLEGKAPFSGAVRIAGAGVDLVCGPERLPELWVTVRPAPAAGDQSQQSATVR